ncbi:MAG: hypothetical protein D6680_18285 [Cyanobacteria bacterium J007]|jgi:hypothetical protein|nr:MAG: hypothetical protein D6680_18285 [Cyanobacteria bacterium J007]
MKRVGMRLLDLAAFEFRVTLTENDDSITRHKPPDRYRNVVVQFTKPRLRAWFFARFRLKSRIARTGGCVGGAIPRLLLIIPRSLRD